MLAAEPSARLPALTTVPPVYVLVPLSETVPDPTRTSEPAPLIVYG